MYCGQDKGLIQYQGKPLIEHLIEAFYKHVDEIIIMGAVTEDAILKAVLGLLQRGKRVTVLTDAIGSLDKNAAEMALRKMEAKGARLVEAKTIVGVSKLNKVGICKCIMFYFCVCRRYFCEY